MRIGTFFEYGKLQEIKTWELFAMKLMSTISK